MRKIWCFEVLKFWREFLTGNSIFFFLKWIGGNGRDLKGGERGNFWANQRWPHHPSPWGVRGSHGTREVLWPWVPRLTHGLAKFGHLASLALSCTLMFFSCILGIRTSISNMLLDCKPWLPHARRRLHNFEKWLRNHLRKRRWSQLNDRNSIRHQIRTCSSPKYKIHKQINTYSHKHAI